MTYTIAYAGNDEHNPFSIALRHSLEIAAQQQDTVRLIIRDNQNSASIARAHIEAFIDLQVDLVLLFQTDIQAGPELIAPLRAIGFPVISVVVPIEGTPFFGPDTEHGGKIAGEELSAWINANWDGYVDRVVVLTDQRISAHAAQRFDAALKALELLTHSTAAQRYELDTTPDPALFRQRFGALLRSWPDHHRLVIIALNDMVAASALELIREQGREADVVLSGMDGTEIAVQEFQKPFSRLIVSPAFHAEQYGPPLLEMALRLLRGVTVPQQYLVPPERFTRDTNRYDP